MLGRVFIDRYETTHFLGQGSMGAVYLARDTRQAERYVVVKVMHDHVAGDAKFHDLFAREIQFMARFKHPHAIDFLDAALADPNGPCIVMEYIPGATLEQVLERHRRLPLGRVAALVPQMCMALNAAHVAGIVHRDLKPANFMLLDPDRPTEYLKVMDLGLAALAIKPYISVEKLKGSQDNIAIGTPAYIAPEQLRGDEMDGRGDIYSLGCVLYELLAGRLPFEFEDTYELITAHLKMKPPPLAEWGVTDVPAGVEAVVMHCLAKYPNERPQTMLAVAQQFVAAAGGNPAAFDPAAFRPVAFRPESGDNINLADFGSGTAGSQVVQFYEAWMPERVAAIKLRGFIEDQGGEIVESLPGLIRVYLGLAPPPKAESALARAVKWLGGSRTPSAPAEPPLEPVAIDLHMTKKESSGYQSKLEIMAVCKAMHGGQLPNDPRWHRRTQKVLKELRSYLIAQG